MDDRQTPTAPPHRMDPLAVLPVFFKLAGKRAVLAGGSEPAVWKAELLSAAGAHIDVVAADPCPGLIGLAAAPPRGSITLLRRQWTSDDLTGAAIAIGAIEEEAEALLFRNAARRAGVPVNVIDKPDFCDFQFGTIVSRSPLVIGISTDGAAPVFGQAIRTRIEAVLPHGVQVWAKAARDWRPQVQALNLGFRARRRFWEAFTARALNATSAAPSDVDVQACMAEALVERDAQQPCVVTLVCAGPGDPSQITLQAIGALQAADIVVHDRDVSPAIISYARREAIKLPLEGSDEASALRKLTAPGRHIAWLDRGDPSRCLRWRRRETALSTMGALTAIVPGFGLCADCSPACPAFDAGNASVNRISPPPP